MAPAASPFTKKTKTGGSMRAISNPQEFPVHTHGLASYCVP
jgi:hypothetical protein